MNGLTSGEEVFSFCKLLVGEKAWREKNGLDSGYIDLKYRKSLFNEAGGLNNACVYGYADRLKPLVDIIKECGGGLKILDAGCGCGSESLMMGLMNNAVVGIDLIPLRAAYASSRIDYFNSCVGNDKIDVHFFAKNILEYLPVENTFDIIWLMESISHIHPAEKFFKKAYDSLKGNGRLIIAESNSLNPVSWYRSYKIRGAASWYVSKKFKYVDVEEHDEVAEERMFTVFDLKKLLIAAGFCIEKVHMSGFIGSNIFPKAFINNIAVSGFMQKVQKVIQKMPVLKYAGANYTIVACRKG